MSNPPKASIREIKQQDVKYIRYLIGAQLLERIALANSAFIFHPKIISIVIALTAVFSHLTGWKPNLSRINVPELGLHSVTLLLFELIHFLPPLGMALAVLLGVSELAHRNRGDQSMMATMKEEDLLELQHYYQKEAGGFWVLDYDGRTISCGGLDIHQAGKALLVAGSAENLSEYPIIPLASTSRKVAQIRRLATSTSFRGEAAFVDEEMLDFLLRQAKAQSVEVLLIALHPLFDKSLVKLAKDRKFQSCGKIQSRVETHVTRQNAWMAAFQTLRRAAENLSPIDWQEELYVLEMK